MKPSSGVTTPAYDKKQRDGIHSQEHRILDVHCCVDLLRYRLTPEPPLQLRQIHTIDGRDDHVAVDLHPKTMTRFKYAEVKHLSVRFVVKEDGGSLYVYISFVYKYALHIY